MALHHSNQLFYDDNIYSVSREFVKYIPNAYEVMGVYSTELPTLVI